MTAHIHQDKIYKPDFHTVRLLFLKNLFASNGWQDPHWLGFLCVLLLPALLSLFSGNLSQIRFYFGAAIYISSLKWIGWVTLGRDRNSVALDFPLHIFTGLGLLTAWFYARNAIGVLIPFSYGLWELKIIWLAALVINLSTAICNAVDRKKINLRLFLTNSVLFVPYVALLFVILEKMARLLHTASTDPLMHSFLAHVYLQSGIFVTGSVAYVGQDGLVYPSGFGAINAVACALSTLDTSQAVNLQHVFLLVTALFLVVGLVVEPLEKPFLILLFSPLLFLWTFPVHNFYSAFNYEGTPRQACVGLFASVTLLPMFSAKLSKLGRKFLFVAWATLATLIVTSNPSCAPFSILAVLFGILLEAAVCVPGSILELIKTVGLKLFLFVAALIFAFSIDPYYSRLFSQGRAANVQNQMDASRGGFSFVKGFHELLGASPLQLTASMTAGNQTDFWADTIVITFGMLFLSIGLLFLRYRARLPEQRRMFTQRMLIIGVVAFAMFLILKMSILLLYFGIEAGSWDLILLKSYLMFNLMRCEYVPWFLLAATTSSAIIACLSTLCQRERDVLIVTAIVAVCLPWIINHQLDNDSIFYRGKAGLTIHSVDANGQITSDDLEFAHWVDETVQAGSGWIALDARSFLSPTPFNYGEKHIYPIDGAQAYYLTSSKYNFCFTIVKTGCAAGYDEYEEHIKQQFDFEWLRNRNIQYFLLSDRSLVEVTGYKQAIEKQQIKLIKHAGRTGFYELNEGLLVK